MSTDDVQTEVVTSDELRQELQRLADDGWTLMSVFFASDDRIQVTVKRRGLPDGRVVAGTAPEAERDRSSPA